MRLRPTTSSCALLTALILSAVAPVGGGGSARAADDLPGWVVDRVRFEPAEPGAGPLTVDGLGAYRGAIEVVPGAGGLAVINDVGLQDYVKGIAEVPGSWPPAALRAQAIAARTYALNRKASAADSPWKADGADICNTDSCQVYGGLAGEQRPDGAGWLEAVDATTGQVLLYKGQPLLAEYSSANGGRTVAGSEPYLRSVPDPDDARSPLAHWHWATSLAALAPVVGVDPPLVLTGLSRQGGTVVLSVVGPDGGEGQAQLSADDFRARVNAALPAPPDLPSPLPSPGYTAEGSGDSAVFDGGGFGHGVGLSQYGALGKAQRGLSAADILAAYYGGIRPQTLEADQLPPTIRVELAAGRGSATVSPERYFKATSGSGAQLGGIESGQWRVVPAKGGVRVIPPADRQPLSLKTAVVDPPGPAGPSPVVHYDLSAPAVVTVHYVTPAGLAGVVPARLVDVGEVAQSLPPPASAGDYQVVIEADAGSDNAVSVPLQVHVEGSARVHLEASGIGGPAGHRRAGALATALLLLVAVSLASYRVSRRQRPATDSGITAASGR
jgi:stage II sporulation protein D